MPFNDALVRSVLSTSSFYVASESKFTSMCCSTRSLQPTLEKVRTMHEISSTCALGTFVGMSEQKEKPYIFVQHFDPASHEFLIYFFCATVRPRRLWQSHKDECALRSSSWSPSEFLAEGGLPRWGVECNVHGDPDGVRWWRCGAGGPHGVWLGWRRSALDAGAWVVGLHLSVDHRLLPLCSLVLFSLSRLFLVDL